MDTICVTEGILGLAFCSVLLAGCSSPSPSTKAMATGPSPLASPTKVHAYLNLAYDRLPESRLHLFVPDGTSRAPLVVLIHGGGWNGGTLDQYDAHCVRLASEGLAAATIEYRFLDQVPMPEIVADVARACAFLAANGREYGYDGSRMFLMGSSAGGHLALVVAARWKELSKELHLNETAPPIGVIAQCPATDMSWMDDPTDPAARQKKLGTAPLEHVSPIHIQPEQFVPVQIVHGDNDDVIPLDNSRQFAERLKEKGVEVELIILPGVGHGFGYNLATPNGLNSYEMAVRFIRQRLGGK